MKPKFKVKKVPGNAFLGCRICLPDDARELTVEIAAEFKREPEDVIVSYTDENGIRYVLVSLREKQEINCRQGVHWIFYARECLNEKREFDLIGATETEINKFDSEAKKYADFSRSSESKQRHKFRLIQQTGD
jgi:hypothetical protein